MKLAFSRIRCQKSRGCWILLREKRKSWLRWGERRIYFGKTICIIKNGVLFSLRNWSCFNRGMPELTQMSHRPWLSCSMMNIRGMVENILKSIKNLTRKIFFYLKLLRYRTLTRKSIVPIVELVPSQGQGINLGPHAGKWSQHQTALLNTLIKFKPRYCLEIGTYYGATAKVFEQYFRKFRTDGRLITADIKRYADLATMYVKPALVYPHVNNPGDIHFVKPDELLPGYADHLRDSVSANIEMLRKELMMLGGTFFDFAYIDGDHQEISFLKDLEIAVRLLAPGSFILIDDIKDECHECAMAYRQKIASCVEHYDFDDWPIFAGLGLVNSTDLQRNVLPFSAECVPASQGGAV